MNPIFQSNNIAIQWWLEQQAAEEAATKKRREARQKQMNRSTPIKNNTKAK